MASPPIDNKTDDKKLCPRPNSFHAETDLAHEPEKSLQRSSSSNRPGSQETSPTDADQTQTGWGPLIKNVPLSVHLAKNMTDTENNVENLLFTLGQQRYFSKELDNWRSPFYDDSDKSDDENVDDKDNIFDEKSLDCIMKILETNHPSVFKFFENLATNNSNLAAKIAESTLVGLQRHIDETGQWRWL